jgi:hypothetical protein
MNYENLARLIDGDGPTASEIFWLSEELQKLRDENARLRDAIAIIEETISTAKGKK